MHISDWHATILSLVGLDNSGIDGIDQTELLFNGGSSTRDEIIFQIDSTFPQFLGNEAIRVGDYKLLRGFPGLYDGYESDGSLGFTHLVDFMRSKRGVHNNQTLARKEMEALKRGNYNFDWGAIAAYVKSVANVVQLYNVIGKYISPVVKKNGLMTLHRPITFNFFHPSNYTFHKYRESCIMPLIQPSNYKLS